MNQFAVSVVTIGTLAACSLADPDDPDDVATTDEELKFFGPPCDDVICGDNSGSFFNLKFAKLHTDMKTPSPHTKLFIKSFKDKNGNAMQPVITGKIIQGRRLDNNQHLAFGDLTGAKMIVTWAPSNGLISSLDQRHFRITFAGSFNNQHYWEEGDPAGAHSGELVGHYLTYVEVNKNGQPLQASQQLENKVCKVPSHGTDSQWTLVPGDATAAGNPGASKHVTLFYGGDVFDEATGQIITGSDTSGWMTLACVGDALSKIEAMRMTEYTQGNDPMEISTSPDEREVALAMIMANYCGDKSYTQSGVKLDWANDHDGVSWNVLQLDPTPGNVEAIWRSGPTPHGHNVVCLSHPRRYWAYDLSDVTCSTATAGGVVPPCTEEQIDNWPLHGDWITVNVQQPPLPPPP